MAFELKENSGSLFKNDRREKDTHPNARGQAKIDGKLYWVSAWTKETKSGEKYQSLSFQLQDAKPERDNSRMSRQTEERYPDDDLDGAPF